MNTPLRAYRAATLRTLMSAVPEDAQVPHVHFSIAEARGGANVRYMRVESLPRRGGDAQGTMWSEGDTIARPQPGAAEAAARVRAQGRGQLWQVSLKPGRRS